MKNKILKSFLITILLVVFLSPIIKVYAESSLIDTILLARNKVTSIVGVLTVDSSTAIEDKATSVENDILGFVDSYIKGLEGELKVYADQERIEAENQLEQQYLNIKTDLENERERLLAEGKTEIKNEVNDKRIKELEKLINKINEKMEKSFN